MTFQVVTKVLTPDVTSWKLILRHAYHFVLRGEPRGEDDLPGRHQGVDSRRDKLEAYLPPRIPFRSTRGAPGFQGLLLKPKKRNPFGVSFVLSFVDYHPPRMPSRLGALHGVSPRASLRNLMRNAGRSLLLSQFREERPSEGESH